MDRKQVEAFLDCRLIDFEKGNHAERFVSNLQKIAAAEDLPKPTITLLNGWNFTQSNLNSDSYRTLKETLEAQFPGTHVAPILIPGGTDSTYFRDPSLLKTSLKPVPAFGFTPAMVSKKILRTFHDVDERLPVDQLVPASMTYYEIVRRLAR